MNFDEAFKITVGHEGGLTLHKNDRGNWTSGIVGRGELKGTKYGISAMSYPKEDIKNLSIERAKQLYKRDYWDKAKCDQLPDGLRFHVFDAAVNSGIKRSIETLQKALNVGVDGLIGNQTISAANLKDVNSTFNQFYAARISFYTSIGTFKDFGKGWMNRVANNLKIGPQ